MGPSVKVDYAKSERQRARNGFVLKARDLLQKDPRSSGKAIKIDWKDLKGKGFRSISVGTDRAFEQGADEVQGSFLSPFSHLNF